MPITHDAEILGGEPRIEGTRIGVRHIVGNVIDGGYSPAYVADQLDISLADVYDALAYYYRHIEEIRDIEREHQAAIERIQESSLKPTERIL